MNTLNSKVVKTFLCPFAQTYNSFNDIKFRKNIDGVMIPSNKGNNAPGVAVLPSPPPPHFPKKLIVSFFILLLLIMPTKKNK